jgi:hypothetical protein
VAQYLSPISSSRLLPPEEGRPFYVVDSRWADKKELTRPRLSSRCVFACLRIHFLPASSPATAPSHPSFGSQQ